MGVGRGDLTSRGRCTTGRIDRYARRIISKLRQFNWLLKMNNQ